MNAGRIIKITFYSLIAIFAMKCAQIAYQKYVVPDDGQSSEPEHLFKLDFNKDINIPASADKPADKSEDPNNLSYNFKNMLELIEASEKVKYLDYLRFSRPSEASQVNPDTLQALIQAMHAEKSKLKRHIAQIKASSRDSIPSRRMKALKYYLRVVELNLQDLKGIIGYGSK